jgi:hypothetical protein
VTLPAGVLDKTVILAAVPGPSNLLLLLRIPTKKITHPEVSAIKSSPKNRALQRAKA